MAVVFMDIFRAYPGIRRVQIVPSDFASGEAKTAGKALCLSEDFDEA